MIVISGQLARSVAIIVCDIYSHNIAIAEAIVVDTCHGKLINLATQLNLVFAV